MSLQAPPQHSPTARLPTALEPAQVASSQPSATSSARLMQCTHAIQLQLRHTLSTWYCKGSMQDHTQHLLEAFTPSLDAIFASDGVPGVLWCGLYFTQGSSTTETWKSLICPERRSSVPSSFRSMMMSESDCARVTQLPPVEIQTVPKERGGRPLLDSDPIGVYLARKLRNFAQYKRWSAIFHPQNTDKSIGTVWHGMTRESVDLGIFSRNNIFEYLTEVLHGRNVTAQDIGEASAVVQDLSWCALEPNMLARTTSNIIMLASTSNVGYERIPYLAVQWLKTCVTGAAHTITRTYNPRETPLNAPQKVLELCTLEPTKFASLKNRGDVDRIGFERFWKSMCVNQAAETFRELSDACNDTTRSDDPFARASAAASQAAKNMFDSAHPQANAGILTSQTTDSLAWHALYWKRPSAL
jgi:hypothetical protein